MIDIALAQDSMGRFDLVFENGDFKKEDGLDTAIWISLFCDARADASEVPQPEHRRGWLGNLDRDFDLGSKLWLIDQKRLTQNLLNQAVDYAAKALEWMKTQDILTDIAATGSIINPYGIRLAIPLTYTNGASETKYFNLWELTGK